MTTCNLSRATSFFAPANVLLRPYSMSSRNVFLLPGGRRIKLSSPKNTRKYRPPNAGRVLAVALLPESPPPAVPAPAPPPASPAPAANSSAGSAGPARRFNITDFLAQIAIDPYLYHFLFGDDNDEDSPEPSPEPAPLPPLDASGRLPRVPLHFADECVVCADAVPVMCAYPCGHVCVCCDCAAELQSRRIITCGVCRTPVSNYVLTDDVAIES
jgi:hypothetical protein